MTRIATVFGATGKQGGSVITALLADGTFKPRAVTRNASSDSALKLKERGCEVVSANMGDSAAMRKAVEGAEVVFAVTVPGMMSDCDELTQGKNIVDASKAAGVKFLVWSSLPSLAKVSNGKYTTVTPFEDKAAIDEHLAASGVPHAIVLTGAFLENAMGMGPIKKSADGGYESVSRASGETRVVFSWIDRDMGPSALALFKHYDTKPKEVLGQRFVFGVCRATYKEYFEILGKALGAPVKVTYIPTVGMKAFDDMWDCCAEFEWYPGQDVPDPRLEALGVKFGSIEEFGRTTLKAWIESGPGAAGAHPGHGSA